MLAGLLAAGGCTDKKPVSYHLAKAIAGVVEIATGTGPTDINVEKVTAIALNPVSQDNFYVATVNDTLLIDLNRPDDTYAGLEKNALVRIQDNEPNDTVSVFTNEKTYIFAGKSNDSTVKSDTTLQAHVSHVSGKNVQWQKVQP